MFGNGVHGSVMKAHPYAIMKHPYGLVPLTQSDVDLHKGKLVGPGDIVHGYTGRGSLGFRYLGGGISHGGSYSGFWRGYREVLRCDEQIEGTLGTPNPF
jgi:hypothetical protein